MTDARSQSSPELDLSCPPPGCSVKITPNGFILSATTRSRGAMYFGEPVTFFFIAIVSFVMYGSLRGELVYAPGTLASPVKGLLFFGGLALAGLLMTVAVVVLIAGRVRISVESDEGQITTGLGFLSRTKRFRLSAVRSVSEVWGNRDSNTHQSSLIVLKTERRIEFGVSLTDARRYFVVHALRQLLGLPEPAPGPVENFSPVDLAHQPRGCRLAPAPNGFALTLTTRHFFAFFSVPMACIWSLVSIYGIYVTQITSGQFDLKLSFLGLPFLLGSAILVAVSAMATCGQARLTVNGNRGEIFIGVGPLGWRRRFDWSSIRRVRNHEASVALDGDERILFGSGPSMTEAQCNFIVSALRQFLAARTEAK